MDGVLRQATSLYKGNQRALRVCDLRHNVTSHNTKFTHPWVYSNVEKAMTAARRLLFLSCSPRTAVLFFFTLKCLQEIPKCIKGSPALTQDRRLFTPRDAKWLSFVWILLLQKSLRPLSCTNVQHTRRMALNTVLLFKFQTSSLLSILSLGLCKFFGYLPFQVFSRSFYAMSEEWQQVYQSDSSGQNSWVVKRKPVIFQERRKEKI